MSLLDLRLSCAARLLQLDIDGGCSLILSSCIDDSAPTSHPVRRGLTRGLLRALLCYFFARHAVRIQIDKHVAGNRPEFIANAGFALSFCVEDLVEHGPCLGIVGALVIFVVGVGLS